jgi:hypothetical protein
VNPGYDDEYDYCECTRDCYRCIRRDCTCFCHKPDRRHPDDLIRGVTLWAKTSDGRRATFRQPIVDPSRKTAGTWSGDPELVNAAMLFLNTDPDESPDNLHSVAWALLYAAGPGGTSDSMSLVLAYHHPREELERQAREREFRDRWGWDDPPDVGL